MMIKSTPYGQVTFHKSVLAAVRRKGKDDIFDGEGVFYWTC